MDEVLWQRSGQYITKDNYSSFFYFNQKVYNGPGFIKHKGGEKKEEGKIKNGFKTEAWTGWDIKGNKKFLGEYKRGKPHGQWTGFYPDGKKKYEGNYKFNFQVGKWTYFNNKGIKSLEENYFICGEECDDTHPDLGKLLDSKEF